MNHLLDVNVLIALVDPKHIHFKIANDWFDAVGVEGWATCPTTQNGVIRIVGHSSYPNSSGSPSAVAAILKEFVSLPSHLFWPDDFSLLDDEQIDLGRLLTSKRITDTYLLALAVRNGGRLATLDHRLAVDPVIGGREALVLI